MGAATRSLLLGAWAALMAVAAIASSEAVAVVVGQARCADCTRKNMKAEAAFKGLKVAIMCKNSNGEYESRAEGELESSGAFSVPLSAELHSADCHAQLHSAAGTPCPGQEPSRIAPLADGTFIAIPGKTQQPSAECASATISGPIKKHFEHFHKKPVPPKPEPEPKPQPEYKPPTPTYGSPSPIYHPPAGDSSDHFHKNHDLGHFFDHFHKKPVPPKPEPETKPQPENKPPTPTYGSPTPIYHPPAMHVSNHLEKDHELDHFFDHFHKKQVPPKPEPKPEPQPENKPPTPTYGSPTPIYHPPTNGDNFHKDHDYHHFFDHFHKKPVPPEPKPEPKPQPEYQPPTPTTPTYGSPTPIYHPPTEGDNFHKDHDYHHFFDHFHKKPVPPEPKPEPKPQPENQPPTPTTPTYGSPTPIYHPPTDGDNFHKDHDYHHFFDHFHKKPVLPEPKPEPKPQPEYHPPTPTYGSSTPIYHPPANH